MSPLLLLPLAALTASGGPDDIWWPRPPAPTSDLVYEIRARLDTGQRRVNGELWLRLKNTSRAALSELRFHLYLNAFASEDTQFMRKSRGLMRLSRADPRHPGWIKVRSVTRGGRRLRHRRLHDGTVMRVALDRPLPPGQQATVRLAFTSQLPRIFARTGFAGDFFMLAQWYPKLGFLRPDGSWHCPPLHFCSEFFGAFADFDVWLELPPEYRVGGTGRWLTTEQPLSGGAVWSFAARRVHDFALAAWPAFSELRARRAGVLVRLLSVPGRGQQQRIMGQVEAGLTRLQRWFAPYPYRLLTVVDVPTRALGAGAMEYPTLFTTWTPWWTPRGVHVADTIILHELTHQYFQGMVANNEVQDPWLDEGVASYVSGLLLDEIHGADGSLVDLGPLRLGYWQRERLRLAKKAPLPVARAATGFNSWGAYGRTVYARAALLLRTVQSLVGRPRMLAALRGYVRRFSFAHPRSRDLEQALVDAAPAGRQELVRDLLRSVLHGSSTLDLGLRCSPGRVEVIRRGRLTLPVVLTVELLGGRSRRLRWDGRGRQRAWPVAGLVHASLGPPERLGLDPTPLDDACQVRGQGPRRAGMRWALLGQALLQLLGP
jgi:hypothetical protein